MNYNRSNYLVGVFLLVLSSIVYLLTMPPTISFWDSGELAVSAYTLSISHPPGAPLWMLINKIATLLPFGSNPAVKINVFSALFSGFTVFFLYLSIVIILKSFTGEIKNKWEAAFVFGSSIIGSLAFAFCISFWTYSTGPDITAFSSMLIGLCIWLSLYWRQNADKKDCDRILILLAYVIGLSLGVNIIVSQIIFAAGLLFYFKRYRFTAKSFVIAFLITCGGFLLIYPVVVIWYPALLSGNLNFLKIENNIVIKILAVLISAAIIIGAIIAHLNNKRAYVIGFTFLICLIAGYSTYSTILIRAKVNDLPVNEYKPQTMNNLTTFVSREQFSGIPFLPRRYSNEAIYSKTWSDYSGDFDFFWRYQVNHMFTRYLGWQFIGRAGYEQDSGIDWNKLYGIPFLTGLFGLFVLFRKNWKFGISFLWLFLVMGILTALYSRYQDPQPRERDYLFQGAYLIFSLWIGIGIFGIIDIIKNSIKSEKAVIFSGIIILIFAFIFVPVNMYRTNVHYTNRSNNLVPFDYAYNMLQSIDKGGLLFTKSDNDTYPLLYLQSIGYRQDIRIINLNLLNNNWYIKELKNSSPYGDAKVPINLPDSQIDMIKSVQWGEFKLISLNVPKELFPDSENISEKISWRIPSTIISGENANAVRKSDLMTLEIIRSNNWKKPVYFSVNVPDEDCIGLNDFLVNEGIVKKLVPYKDESGQQFRTDENMYKNLMTVDETPSKTQLQGYLYRGFNDNSILFDDVTINLVQNYRTQFLKLAYSFDDTLKVEEVLDKMGSLFPVNIIPMDYRIQHNAAMLYAKIGNMKKFGELSFEVEKKASEELIKNPNDIQSPWNPYKLLLDIYETRGDSKNELDILYKLYKVTPESPEVKAKIEAIKSKLNGNNGIQTQQ